MRTAIDLGPAPHYHPRAVTARFWAWHNHGAVKIDLQPGDRLRVVEGGPTDEGFSWEQTTYYYDGRHVYREIMQESKDCDGRMDHYSAHRCHVLKLAARVILPNPLEYDDRTADALWPYCEAVEDARDNGARFPSWEKLDAHQRDYAAERAGY